MKGFSGLGGLWLWGSEAADLDHSPKGKNWI